MCVLPWVHVYIMYKQEVRTHTFLQVSSAVLRLHVAELLKVLLECFKDDSWLVRDGESLTKPHTHTHTHTHTSVIHYVAACLACGNFMSSFPDECKPTLPELLPLFMASLEDSMPSVRQGAASSLATIVKVYGNTLYCLA